MDRGSRRFDVVGLEQDGLGGLRESPLASVSPNGGSVGSAGFKEVLGRHIADHPKAHENRQERLANGLVKWGTHSSVPDVGGMGWRTRSGHMLKNQSYYSKRDDQNWWDVPGRAGLNTWTEFHGPRLKTDAPMMQQLDNFDDQADAHEARKTFVNTRRVETLDRFHNRKLHRSQLQASQSWAPHCHARRDVHECHETFSGDLDSQPTKALKAICTADVLKRDRDATRNITKRIQNEETWKAAWKHMEQERRHDLRENLEMRRQHNDMLEYISGQPPRKQDGSNKGRNNCSDRTESLAAPRPVAKAADVTKLVDFRGLVHADQAHALEALLPGHGHELSTEFCARLTASAQAGWPPPPEAQTPRRKKGPSTEKVLQKDASLATGPPVPVSPHRLQAVASRTHDEAVKQHSKAQFLSTVAPPPPDQNKTILREDFSPNATLQDPGRMTGNLMRTDHSSTLLKSQSSMHLPPPTRSYVYPVLAPASPNASPSVSSSLWHTSGKAATTKLKRNQSAPGDLAQTTGSHPSNPNRGHSNGKSRQLCQELDDFEATAPIRDLCAAGERPRHTNFFGTPRATRGPASRSHGPSDTLGESVTE